MSLEDALRAELVTALQRRDTVVVAAVRSALAALANAEAIPAPVEEDEGAPTAHIAKATAGLAATEAPRAALAEPDQRRILAAEMAELAAHHQRLLQVCRRDDADGVRRAVQVLTGVLQGHS